jgi:hypothetical protein
MRTTVRIDDDLMHELKSRSQRENVSLTKFLNRVIRRGLSIGEAAARKKSPFRQKTYDMGVPRFDVTKALALAAELEDEAIIEKLRQGK